MHCDIRIPTSILGMMLCLGGTICGRAQIEIVVPTQALPVVTYAAEELRYHIEKATGHPCPIRSLESKIRDLKSKTFRLGDTPRSRAAGIDITGLPPNAFVMKTVSNDLFLVGRDAPGAALADNVSAGTLFAVYEFLETQMGVRWLWPGTLGEVIPPYATVPWPRLDTTVSPRLLHTRLRGAYGYGTEGWSNPGARTAYLSDQQVWLRRHRFARGTSLEYGHAFIKYWERFGTTHPEFFNLLPDGTRRCDPLYFGGPGELTSMCVSEPALWRQIVEDWQTTRTLEQPWLNCAENDTPGKCLCDKCLTWDGDSLNTQRVAQARQAYLAHDPNWTQPLGQVSDRYARWWAAVRDEARKVDTNVTVIGYSYANYKEPPRHTRLNDHIVIGIVPELMFPWSAEARRLFREQWQGWADTGVRLYLRPNYTLMGHNLPIFYARHFAEDFGFAAQRGMVATDFDSLTGQWGTQGPNLYALARMHEHPDWPAQRVLDEYYAGFGPARKAVRNYFRYWEKLSDGLTDRKVAAIAKSISMQAGDIQDFARFHRFAVGIFTPDVMARGSTLLQKARVAAKGDPEAEQRVAFLEKGLRNADLTLAAVRAWRQHATTGDYEALAAALDTLAAYRAQIERDDVANMGYLAWSEGNTWDKKLLDLMSQRGQPLPTPWKFMWDPQDTGVSNRWFADDGSTQTWLDIGVGTPWEKQPAGMAWASTHANKDYDGIAWYRNTFSVTGAPSARYAIGFGAVDEACTVWVNGQSLLQRPYPCNGNPNSWQEAFEVDVTSVIRRDRPNTVAVRVEDQSGDGGLWKPVWLIEHAAPADAAHNAVTNGGFESGTSGWLTSVMCGEFGFDVDTQTAYSGKASARIICRKAEAVEPKWGYSTAWGRWYQGGIHLTPNQSYCFRFRARTSAHFAGRVAVWVRGPGVDTNVDLLSTDGLWKEVTVDNLKAATAGETTLYFNLMAGEGTVWIDDIELTPTAQ